MENDNKINDGGAAFPKPDVFTSDGAFVDYAPSGMSLRDYFAAKAMAALIQAMGMGYHGKNYEGVTKDSWFIADEMLKARGQA